MKASTDGSLSLANKQFNYITSREAKCLFCDKEYSNTSILEKHMKRNHNDLHQPESVKMTKQLSFPKEAVELPNGEIVQVSNNMGDQVKTVCQICCQKVSTQKMHIHTRIVHNKSPLEYKEKFGNHSDHSLKSFSTSVQFVHKYFYGNSPILNTTCISTR